MRGLLGPGRRRRGDAGARLGAGRGRSRRERTLGFARAVARSLGGDKVTSDQIVSSELWQVFAGAQMLARERQSVPPGTGLIRDHLAPYAARALDRAEAGALERGAATGRLYSAVVADQNRTFGLLGSYHAAKTAAFLSAAGSVLLAGDGALLLLRHAQGGLARLAFGAFFFLRLPGGRPSFS